MNLSSAALIIGGIHLSILLNEIKSCQNLSCLAAFIVYSYLSVNTFSRARTSSTAAASTTTGPRCGGSMFGFVGSITSIRPAAERRDRHARDVIERRTSRTRPQAGARASARRSRPDRTRREAHSNQRGAREGLLLLRATMNGRHRPRRTEILHQPAVARRVIGRPSPGSRSTSSSACSKSRGERASTSGAA